MSPTASALPKPPAGLRPTSINRRARQLGYSGLLPFVAGALLVWLVDANARPHVARGMSAYAGLIVSFLGALHWGIAMRQSSPDPRLFVWGIVPALIAWIAVMMPPDAGLIVSGVMLLVCYAVDRKVYPVQGVAVWLKLRFHLSALAALCCFVGAAGSRALH